MGERGTLNEIGERKIGRERGRERWRVMDDEERYIVKMNAIMSIIIVNDVERWTLNERCAGKWRKFKRGRDRYIFNM